MNSSDLARKTYAYVFTSSATYRYAHVDDICDNACVIYVNEKLPVKNDGKI
jgi:hypothetical protein